MWDKVGPKNWRRPLLLRPDNFTPASRTPWGGHRIRRGLKQNLGLSDGATVGESWELSVEPDFPSRLADGPLLDDVLRSDPEALLGAEATRASTALLVKLLDAADDLSLQIHPADDDPDLAEGQSGKLEAWYVIDAWPDAGLFLGLRNGVTASRFEAEVRSGGDVASMLSFVPVETGDVFLIEPGTPHSIGKGVLLLEPQRVLPGRRGVTYRYWDWNRRYDREGRVDSRGEPRALHLSRALEVTDWGRAREGALLDEIRYRSRGPTLAGPARVQPLIGAAAPVRSEAFDVYRVEGTGQVDLPSSSSLRSFTVLDGTIRLIGSGAELALQTGQTAALPACVSSMRADLVEAQAIVCSLIDLARPR